MDRLYNASFVGRTNELTRLEAALATASAGAAGAVLISGEAGIGKTRLVDELADRARARTWRVLAGGCFELSGGGLPYGPFVEAFLGLVRNLDAATGRSLLEPGQAELFRILLLPEGQARPAGDELTPVSAQARLFEQVLGLLGRLSEESPILCIVEDLHWADRSTLDLLSFLVRNLRGERVLIVMTYRSDEVRGRQHVRDFLAEQVRGRRTAQFELEAFGREDLTSLVESLLGAPTGPEVVERILVSSGGNAFFAEELAVGVSEQGVQLSVRLRDVIMARVEALPDEVQAVLRVVATADRRVGPGLLAAVATLPEQDLFRALKEAVDSRFLVGDAETQTYVFRHALVREAIHAELARFPGELARLHGAIARALAHQAVSDDQVATPEVELAHHWQAANDFPRALAASVEAGRSVAGIYAFTEAHRQFERAIRLWGRVPDAAALVGLTHSELLELASSYALWAGDVHQALGYVDRALAEMDPAQDPARAGLLQECRGRYLWRSGDTEGALAAHAQAVRLLAAEPASPARARALGGYGSMLMLRSRYSESRAPCEEAVAMARTIGVRREEGYALNTLGVVLTMTGEPDAGIAHLLQALGIAEELDNFEDLHRAYANLAFAYENAGRLEQAAEMALRGIKTARKLRLEDTAGAVVLINAVDLHYLLGRWREAEELLDDAPYLEANALFGPYLNLSRAQLDTARGRFGQAGRYLEAARSNSALLTEPSFHGPFQACLAELAIWQGEHRRAKADIETGLELMDASEDAQLALRLCALGLRADADEAERSRLARDAEPLEPRRNGAELVASARDLVERLARRGRVLPDANCAALLCEAEHSRLEGRSSSSRWEATAAAYDDLCEPYRAAYARWRQAEALLGDEDAGQAAAILRQAYDIAVRLGAEPLRNQIQALARRSQIELSRSVVEART